MLKIVSRGRRNTFVTFSEDVLQFSWQAQHFGRVHRHFSWQAQHFRCVLLRVFCESHWQGCVKWRQGANSVAGVAFCAMDALKIDGSLARNIDFDVENFQVLRKTRRKTSILKLQSVKIGGSLVRNDRFGAPTCLVSIFWFSCVYGGSCTTSPFVMLPTLKIGGSLARNAGFSASTCLVSSLWFSCGFAVSMGEAGKHILFEGFQACCHVVLRGRRGTL